MESTRQTWNGQRMDEFAQRTEENFREMRREIRQVETGLRSEMKERFGRLEAKFNIVFGALATGFVAVVLQHFVG